ncbi:SDR family oxidoreductase [Actinomycetospora chlora]|uniref:SDR family oxidoreductase n=1 Tax=Actinomycetospora chlora TaxID=663608 RepID=A0ABP9B469_9PSEU
MRCAVIGATGYVGVRLVARLLTEGHDVAVLVRSPGKLAATGWAERVDAVPGDLADNAALAALVEGADAVVHLAHALEHADFPDRDRAAARAVSDAAERAGVRRLVYLGGLRPSGAASRHLSSRAEVADIFLAGPVPTVALEASIVVGSGSASFEMIRYLAERVPVLPAVPWLAHRTQPVAVADVLHYLVGALHVPADVDRRFDVGGPDVLTYLELVRRYLRLAGLPQSAAVPVPLPVPPGAPALAGWVVEALTPLSRHLVTPLIESLAEDLVCGDDDVLDVIGPPPGGRTTYDAAVRAALGQRPETPLAPGDPALAGPTDPAGSGGAVYRWGTGEACPADADALWAVVDGIGGDAGWAVPLGAWTVRGWADQLLGGVGGYRGRPQGRPLEAGDVVDGWRVEAVAPGSSLRLRSELRQPGRMTLELAVDPDVSGHGSHLRLSFAFAASGLAGLAYGTALRAGAPVVFGAMARGLVARATSVRA